MSTVTKLTNDDMSYRVVIEVNDLVVVTAKSDSGDTLGDVVKAAAEELGLELEFNGNLLPEKAFISDGNGTRSTKDANEVVEPGSTIIVDKEKENG